MAKALHPFIHDGRQYYCGEEVLAEGEELKRLIETGRVEADKAAAPAPAKEAEKVAEIETSDDEPRRSRGKKKG